jgi:hypothetical protein
MHSAAPEAAAPLQTPTIVVDLSPFVFFSRSSLDISHNTYALLDRTGQYTVAVLLPLGAFDKVAIHRFTDTLAPFACLICVRPGQRCDPIFFGGIMQVPVVKLQAARTHRHVRVLRVGFIVFAVLMASMLLGAGQLWAQCGSLKAPSTTWQNGGNSFWGLDGNWTSGTPTASTNACILNGTSTVTLNATGNVLGLQLATGNTLIISGAVPGGASLTDSSGGRVINNGMIGLSTGSLSNSSGASLINNGSIGGGSFSNIVNSGTVQQQILYPTRCGLGND